MAKRSKPVSLPPPPGEVGDADTFHSFSAELVAAYIAGGSPPPPCVRRAQWPVGNAPAGRKGFAITAGVRRLMMFGAVADTRI